MQRILVSLSIIGVVAAFVIGGTIAYFHDVEVAEQEFVVGTLDLTVDGGNVIVYIVDIDDVVPGSHGMGDTELRNVGTLSGELDITMGSIDDVESTGITEFEGDGDPGELGANLKMVLWIDTNQNDDFDGADFKLLNNGTTALYYEGAALTFVDAYTYSEVSWDAVRTMGRGAFDDFRISWRVPSDVSNDIQGDSMSFDVTFTLEQTARD